MNCQKAVDERSKNDMKLNAQGLADRKKWEEKGYEIIENRDFMPVILMSMTKRERECIALTILEERTQEETSRILGLSQSYVSKSIKSGLSKARKAYWSN